MRLMKTIAQIERGRISSLKYYHKNKNDPAYKARIAAQNARYYARNRGKWGAKIRARYLMRVYGLEVHQFDALWEHQGGTCALCDKTLTRRSGGHAIDHDHVTDVVRGLLCVPCNGFVVAAFEHKLFERVTSYLQAPPAVALLGPVRPIPDPPV